MTYLSSDDLLIKYSPILYFHPDEKYFPCSVDWLLQNSRLVNYINNVMVSNIYPVTQRILYNQALSDNFKKRSDGSLILSFTEELYRGETPLNKVPCYCIYRETDNKIYLTYIFLYAKNGEYSILDLVNVGQHPGDIEHITVELDLYTQNCIRVLYSAHTNNDSRWVNYSNIEKENDKIIVYVALNGHGLYPKEGIAFRYYGLANDYMKKGIKWIPSIVRLYGKHDNNFNIDMMGFTTYNGRIGGSIKLGDTSGIMGLPDKKWYGKNGTLIDIISENELKPPLLLSLETSKYLYIFQQLIVFIIIYFFIYFILYLSNKLFGNNRNSFTYFQHFMTIIFIFIFFKLITYVAPIILIKYLPS
jgi:hypothetical protein